MRAAPKVRGGEKRPAAHHQQFHATMHRQVPRLLAMLPCFRGFTASGLFSAPLCRALLSHITAQTDQPNLFIEGLNEGTKSSDLPKVTHQRLSLD